MTERILRLTKGGCEKNCVEEKKEKGGKLLRSRGPCRKTNYLQGRRVIGEGGVVRGRRPPKKKEGRTRNQKPEKKGRS